MDDDDYRLRVNKKKKSSHVCNDKNQKYTHHIDFNLLDLETKNDGPNETQNKTGIAFMNES